jgi:iron complex outermembrane recepter protein
VRTAFHFCSSAIAAPFCSPAVAVALRSWAVAVALLATILSESVSAQMKPRDLAQASLEDLMRIEVTSAGRKEQQADSVPGAVYVLSADDIRRSGMRTLPDVLRLVPGVQVAQVNSSRWAVSVRGFNNLYANKLLVLIDGRSLYNRAFSGVFWDAQDVLIEDIERVEVIRGPGGAVWGANAVNGVINIVTKTAADTRGGLVRVGGGTIDRGTAAVRYGGSLGPMNYRLSSQWSSQGESLLDRSTTANDNWDVLSNSGRLDWERGPDALTVGGSFLTNSTRALGRTLAGPSPGVPRVTGDVSGTNESAVFARWTRTQGSGASLQIQSFLTARNADIIDVHGNERVADLDVQYHARVGSRHDVVVGGGYRWTRSVIDGSFTYAWDPGTSVSSVANVFVQDEVTVARRVRVTLGSKVERELVTGWSLQPTARAIWDAAPHHHVWIAASRAVRTPSASELNIRVNLAAVPGAGGLPVLLGIVGNPAYRTEKFADVEAGYRAELGTHAAVDVTAFRGRYRDLQTLEPMAPRFEALPAPAHVFAAARLGNLLSVETTGLEVAAHWIPVEWWRVDGSYSALHLAPHLDSASHDPAASRFDGSAPARQWQVQSSGKIGGRIQLNAGLFHSGRLRELGVPAYTRADVRMEGELTERLSVIATGQNLQSRAHAEFGGAVSVLPTLVPRTLGLHLLWHF